MKTVSNFNMELSGSITENDEIAIKINEKKIFWSRKQEELKLTEDLTGLSKSKQKKLLKKKVYEELRLEKRKQERERKKEKRAQRREAGLPLPESRKSKKRKNLVFSNYKVAIDLDFFDNMNERDLKMLLKQVKTCYSVNRNHIYPMQLYLTSYNHQLKDLFMKLQPGLVNWSIHFEESGFLDVFDLKKIVYLTSDSENTLNTLDEDKIYIIGGLVDHNHHKGLCHKIAVENSIAHAKLPIDEFVRMNSRKVLTINHVFEILLEYSETKDWKSAFFKVLPNRKGFKMKDESESESKCFELINNAVNTLHSSIDTEDNHEHECIGGDIQSNSLSSINSYENLNGNSREIDLNNELDKEK